MDATEQAGAGAGQREPWRVGASHPKFIAGQWPKGVSGHPIGRPSRRPILELMRRELRRLQPDLEDGDEELLIARAWLTMITADRNVAALKEWLDRTLGPVVQKQEVQVSVLERIREEYRTLMRAREVEVEAPVAELAPPQDQEVEGGPEEVAQP